MRLEKNMNYLTMTFSKQKKKLLKLKILFQKLKKRLKKATMLVGHSLAECSAELRRERIENRGQETASAKVLRGFDRSSFDSAR